MQGEGQVWFQHHIQRRIRHNLEMYSQGTLPYELPPHMDVEKTAGVEEIFRHAWSTVQRGVHQCLTLKETLVLLGMRTTQGSVFTRLPPAPLELVSSAREMVNSSHTVAGRALTKHSVRNPVWGEVRGRPEQVNMLGSRIVEYILSHHTWWNMHHHHHHGEVVEYRLPDGRGVRWQLKPLKFIGFLEPVW